MQELKKYGVTTVVRVCEATYDAALVVKEGIQVLVSSDFWTAAKLFINVSRTYRVYIESLACANYLFFLFLLACLLLPIFSRKQIYKLH